MNCICGFKIFGNTQNSFNFFFHLDLLKIFVSFCECEIILEVLWCFQKVFLCSNLYCTWLFHISFSVLIHPADYCTKLELWRRLTNQAHSDWVFLFVTKEKKKQKNLVCVWLFLYRKRLTIFFSDHFIDIRITFRMDHGSENLNDNDVEKK